MLSRLKGSLAVSVGIFGSRVAGFVRESVFAHYFGNSMAADAFRAALRIPNLLQNLFGEGVLSASFIPVYSRLRSEGREEEARAVANSIFVLLAVTSTALAALGVVFTPQLIDLITPGFEGEKRELSIRLVRVLFPGTALLVISAWCLGVQNSHRKFLLSYSAPIFWNSIIILSLLIFGSQESSTAICYVTWGVTFGSAAQLFVQLPMALRLSQILTTKNSALPRPFLTPEVKQVLRNLIPVTVSRGVVQISAFVDAMIASLLEGNALSVLSYAQTLYLLPVSLFSMSVSAAELPELSSMDSSKREEVIERVRKGVERILFFVLPSAAAFIFLGDRLIALVFQSGAFKADDTLRVWTALIVLSLGLPLSTVSRLFSSVFYARNEARKLLFLSVIRVFVSSVIGLIISLYFGYGLPGLCAGTTMGAILEFSLLGGMFKNALGSLPSLSRTTTLLGLVSIFAGVIARYVSSDQGKIMAVILAVICFGVLYLSAAIILKAEQIKFLKRG